MTKSNLSLSIVVGLVSMLATPALADLQAGLGAYKRSDYETALKEFRPLAEQGDVSAQYNLGEMYMLGRGVPQDYTQAYVWVALAAAQGYEKAIEVRDLLEELMTPSQLAVIDEVSRPLPTWRAPRRPHTEIFGEQNPLHGERIISKADADYVFNLTKPEWEAYANRMIHPMGWEARLAPHDTGTAVMAFNPATGFGLSIQPFYSDDDTRPGALMVGSYFPLGTLPEFTDEYKNQIEAEAKTDLGSDYSVSAIYKKMSPTLEGLELLIGKEIP
ncbi:MAG: sel1 repeat family protein [Nitrospinae bacterium]|nr:sel1 repeat family protein [Nitrospinota bacterium]